MAEESPDLSPEVAAALAAIEFRRSPDYRTIFSDLHRFRLGNGTVNIVFSKTAHVPGIQMNPTVFEEEVEIVVSWMQLKMITMNLAMTIHAIEQELGEISIPEGFGPDFETAIANVRSLNIPRPQSPKG